MEHRRPQKCQCPGRGPCLGRWPCTRPHKLVETVNSLSPSEFFDRYLPPESLSAITGSHDTAAPPGRGRRLQALLIGAGQSLTDGDKAILDECLKLVESTSAEDYRRSEVKWSAAKKRKEMLLPDMRYVVLLEDHEPAAAQHDPSASWKVAGFVSFMITYEDGQEVIYCYEIHLTAVWQGKGLGKKLMAVVEGVGRNVGVAKSMLTVFRANERAVMVYERLGYSEDEFSPGPRRLRNGTVKEPSYVILSKDLRETG